MIMPPSAPWLGNYITRRLILKLAHPGTILPSGFKGIPHRLALVSLVSFKHVHMTDQPNMLGLSFEDSCRAEPLRAALTELCINESHSLFASGGMV